MLRDRQEKEQLVRKFEEIVPFLKTQNNFGFIVPECDLDPIYYIYPSDVTKPNFSKITVNIKTGWHSRYRYMDEDENIHLINEGVTPTSNDWSDYCWKHNHREIT